MTNYNGRVPGSTNARQQPFSMASSDGVFFGGDAEDDISRNIDSSQVSRLFFGPTNVEALQQGIRYGVYRATDGRHVIDKQSETELRLIMRSIYLQHARNAPDQVLAQVRELNGMVLRFAVPRIVEEINMYLEYRRQVEKMPVPMGRGEIATMKGTKTLEMREF